VVQELLAREVAPLDLPRGQIALHHHLRGDTGMVGARLPKHVIALHALLADQNVLERVVERVAHMQRAGDIGRRNDDGEAFSAFPLAGTGREGLRLIPGVGDARSMSAGAKVFSIVMAVTISSIGRAATPRPRAHERAFSAR
jgi:hypothetical protein